MFSVDRVHLRHGYTNRKSAQRDKSRQEVVGSAPLIHDIEADHQEENRFPATDPLLASAVRIA